jgi:hypothetical protein
MTPPFSKSGVYVVVVDWASAKVAAASANMQSFTASA